MYVCLCTCMWWDTLHYLVRQEHIFTRSHYQHSTSTHAQHASTHVSASENAFHRCGCRGWCALLTINYSNYLSLVLHTQLVTSHSDVWFDVCTKMTIYNSLMPLHRLLVYHSCVVLHESPTMSSVIIVT